MNDLPNYVVKFMDLSKKLGHGYVFHRFIYEMKTVPVIANKIILNKPLPKEYQPDEIVILSILRKIETEIPDKIEVYCFQCGRKVEDVSITPGTENGYFLCHNCNMEN